MDSDTDSDIDIKPPPFHPLDDQHDKTDLLVAGLVCLAVARGLGGDVQNKGMIGLTLQSMFICNQMLTCSGAVAT